MLVIIEEAAMHMAAAYTPGTDWTAMRSAFAASLAGYGLLPPVNENTAAFCIAGFAIWGIAALYICSQSRGKWRRNEEHGSAKFADPKVLRRKWEEKGKVLDRNGFLLTDPNLILSENMRIGLNNGAVHRKNRNMLVVGGSGTRKSTGIVMPNIMQANSSLVITDPSGELYAGCGALLAERGYDVRCLNLTDMEKSHRMNPFQYIETEEDIARLATAFMINTDDRSKKGGDQFWTDAMRLLLISLIAYICESDPPDKRTFGRLTRLVRLGRLESEDMHAKSDLDILFELWGEEHPDSLAAANYQLYMGAAPKTRASVVITLSSRLAVFNVPAAADLTSTDELMLGKMGEKKTALFCIIPTADTTYNFLVGLVYTSLFSVLYRRAEQQKERRLTVPVHVMMDEFANVAQPESFEQILSTCRKYNISISIFVQNMTQLKKLYEKEWESIAGNCDSLIYLGGNEKFTWEYISKALDKQTINARSTGKSGRNSSVNQQVIGRQLMTPGEVRNLPDRQCLVLVRGENGARDNKYDVTRHPNFRRIAMGGGPCFSQNIERLSTEDKRQMNAFIRQAEAAFAEDSPPKAAWAAVPEE